MEKTPHDREFRAETGEMHETIGEVSGNPRLDMFPGLPVV